MRTISVFDTSIEAYNIGNEIIMDAVSRNLDTIFPNDFIIRLPIEDIGKTARKYNSLSELTFVGGTNALNGDIRHYRQWNLSLHNIMILRRVLLMGCGWFQYENQDPTKYTKWAFEKILSKDYIHSVRDGYTLRKCENLNLQGVQFINTGCPTLWGLTDNHISDIPKQKNATVVFTITDYNKNPERDKVLVDTLLASYDNIFFFPQGTGDIEYITQLMPVERMKLLRPRLYSFDELLDFGADYIGTRLHAGVRALQRKCRSFIIGIDNRAMEMGADFGLPVLAQNNISDLSGWINQSYDLRLRIPWENIEVWKSQFSKI